MKTTIKFVSLLVIILFIGCKPETQFFWGNYSKTLYDYKKNPDDKTLAEHKKSLTEIILQSSKKHKPVPPGVYAELGYLTVREGNETEGNEYFKKEMLYYPESKVFIEKLLNELHPGESK
ncbi:MAG: DUF4810 domain-containing protein [Bacteroidota bacterium]|jgi:hypothetical protein